MAAVADHQTLGEAQAAGFIANPVEINAGDEQIRASVTPWRLPADKVEALIPACTLHSPTSASRWSTRWRLALPIRAGSRRAYTTVRSRRSAKSASPT